MALPLNEVVGGIRYGDARVTITDTVHTNTHSRMLFGASDSVLRGYVGDICDEYERGSTRCTVIEQTVKWRAFRVLAVRLPVASQHITTPRFEVCARERSTAELLDTVRRVSTLLNKQSLEYTLVCARV